MEVVDFYAGCSRCPEAGMSQSFPYKGENDCEHVDIMPGQFHPLLFRFQASLLLQHS